MALDGIVYVNTHAAPRGAGKGSPLTVDEADDNFYELYTRLKALEDSPPTAVSISNISVSGTQMLVTMSDASTFGPFTLPIAKLNFRGDYAPGMTLAALDLVNVPNQGLYMTLIENTDSDDPFDGTKTDGSGHPLFNLVFATNTLIYDVGFFYPGRPGLGIDSAGWMFAHRMVREVTAPASLTDSVASLRVAPAADLSFPIYKNGGTSIGSVDFALGAAVGTFTFADDTDFAVGDTLQVGPSIAADTAAKDLTLTFTLIRVAT